MVLIKKQNYSQGTDSHAETIEFDAIGQHVKNGKRKPEFDSRIGHHVKKSKRGARRQKAATVLPNRTAAA